MYRVSSDFESLFPQVIYLDSTDIAKASSNSKHISEIAQQWSVYLHGLALYGFKSWLETKFQLESLQIEKSTLFDQKYTCLLDEACNVNFNSFKFCIIATENIIEDFVYISQVSIDLTDLTPHFYVIVEVLEEQEEIYIRGFLESSCLREYLDQKNIPLSEAWKYRIPLSLFNSNASKLSFYLKHLDISDFKIPSSSLQVSYERQCSESVIQDKISKLNFSMAMWEQLDSQEALLLLSSPQLLSYLHQQSDKFKQQSASKQAGQTIPKQYLNLTKWINSGLDQMIKDLGFLDTLQTQPALQLRTTRSLLSEKFRMAIANLKYEGLDIPEPIKPLYRMMSLGDLEICLCLVPCLGEETQIRNKNSLEIKSLLVLAGSSDQDEALPVGFQIEVKSDNNVLESHQLEFEESLIYSFVDLQDLTAVDIELITPDGHKSILPTFTVDQRG